MSNEFDEVMSKRTNADLIGILNGPPEDYQPTALEAAKRELARRNLSEQQINTATLINKQKEEVIQEKADEPLRIGWKILAFVFPGFFYVMVYGILKSEGYDKKGSELLRWTGYGFGFYLALIIFTIALSKFL